MLLITFFLAYRFVPRQKVDYRAALSGAILAAGLFAQVGGEGHRG